VSSPTLASYHFWSALIQTRSLASPDCCQFDVAQFCYQPNNGGLATCTTFDPTIDKRQVVPTRLARKGRAYGSTGE
jgi:hypothetical protein